VTAKSISLIYVYCNKTQSIRKIISNAEVYRSMKPLNNIFKKLNKEGKETKLFCKLKGRHRLQNDADTILDTKATESIGIKSAENFRHCVAGNFMIYIRRPILLPY
jgi:hypothetical protein